MMRLIALLCLMGISVTQANHTPTPMPHTTEEIRGLEEVYTEWNDCSAIADALKEEKENSKQKTKPLKEKEDSEM